MNARSACYTLAHGISCCRIGDRYIFLDEQADRYLALGRDEDAAMAQLLADESGAVAQHNPLAALVRRGLLVPSASPQSPLLCEKSSPSNSIAPAHHRLSWRLHMSFAWKVATARRTLRWRSLASALDRLRHIKRSHPRSPDTPDTSLQTAADLFGRITRFMTRHDACLPISLGLAAYLLGEGVECDLVIGVQLAPFHAHCWVQHENWLIGDDLDAVRTFTPILVV